MPQGRPNPNTPSGFLFRGSELQLRHTGHPKNKTSKTVIPTGASRLFPAPGAPAWSSEAGSWGVQSQANTSFEIDRRVGQAGRIVGMQLQVLGYRRKEEQKRKRRGPRATPRHDRPRHWLPRKYPGRRALCREISRLIPAVWPPGSGAPRGKSWPSVELWVAFRAA